MAVDGTYTALCNSKRGSMLKIDTHVHTIFSIDAMIRPSNMPKILRRKGLDGAVVLDHDLAGAFKCVPRENIVIIPGVELSTDVGHIVGLFVEEDIRTSDAMEAIDEIKERGGLSILAHPDQFPRAHKASLAKLRLIARRVDGIEVYNGRTLRMPWMKLGFKLAEDYGKAMIAGSDAHFDFEVGTAYTVAPGASEEDFYKDVKMGKTKAVYRPRPPIGHLLSLFVKLMRLKRRLRAYVSMPIIHSSDLDFNRAIVNIVESLGIVVTSPWVAMGPSRELSPEEVYLRDLNTIDKSDLVIAEVSTPSHGVGAEIMYAIVRKKPVIAVYRRDAKVSYMLLGAPMVIEIEYEDLDELRDMLKKLLVYSKKR
ncbi:MAG: hypothetical protein DRM97_01405 [Thermoprotei archaeon]|nr:MAG: hypothetical protein DRM97_01405 [Thermoprotei archaeon]